MSEPILEVENLVKRYGAFTALDGVSLRIEPGEIFALLGPNGAGKTTLIGAVCGLVKKTSGKVRVLGTDLDQDPISPRFRIGLVPQEINFDPFFTVQESLEYQLGYFGKPNDPARIAEVLRELSLQDKAQSRTRALSGGMKRRLLIAKALVHRPQLLFLDEPTAGVDVELRRDLWRYVRRLRDEGTTIILTTHYLEEAEELADRIGIINEGKLLSVEPTSALLRRLGEKQLQVTFARPVEQLPAPAVQAGAVLSADRTRLTLTQREGAQGSGEVLRSLYRAQLEISDVETRRSRLEDVMIRVLRGG
ncbi:MAG: ABC transporter ATP-binding protein [Myxococcota bacterium]|nr:ABC transporter ATP-binding protein [Myxococcota bacterium]